jgi:TAT (twin-arginine translocation) pathway signal sequence
LEMSRRQFLQGGGLAAAGLALGGTPGEANADPPADNFEQRNNENGAHESVHRAHLATAVRTYLFPPLHTISRSRLTWATRQLRCANCPGVLRVP